MRDRSFRFRVSGPNIVSEIIEREAIIINLDSGSYYSLQEAGADIWAGVQDGMQIKEIIDRLAMRYEGDKEAIRSAAMDLLTQLEDEALIKSDGAASEAPPASVPDVAAADKVPFSPPVLHKYTDMQELLVLDPIHEVDASGWPKLTGDDTECGE